MGIASKCLRTRRAPMDAQPASKPPSQSPPPTPGLHRRPRRH
jgi:hypothetical protein